MTMKESLMLDIPSDQVVSETTDKGPHQIILPVLSLETLVGPSVRRQAQIPDFTASLRQMLDTPESGKTSVPQKKSVLLSYKPQQILPSKPLVEARRARRRARRPILKANGDRVSRGRGR